MSVMISCDHLDRRCAWNPRHNPYLKRKQTGHRKIIKTFNKQEGAAILPPVSKTSGGRDTRGSCLAHSWTLTELIKLIRVRR